MLFRLAEVHRVLRNEISERGKIHHSAKNYTERHNARGSKLFRGMSKHTLIFCADESGNVTHVFLPDAQIQRNLDILRANTFETNGFNHPREFRGHNLGDRAALVIISSPIKTLTMHSKCVKI